MEAELPGNIEKVIIIGCGYHARCNLIPAILHTGLFSEILIYDISDNTFNFMKNTLSYNDLEKIRFYDAWIEVEQELNPELLAVISTPADSHLHYFKKLVKRGVQFIYIEKPLVQSLKDIDELYSLYESGRVKVASGFYNSFVDPVVNFSEYQTQYNLGPLGGVKAYGGNNDLSAFGIHIIDLANILFNSDATNIISNITGKTANPRGNNYFYYGGTIVLEYPEAKELTISYQPNSFISNRVQLIFKYGLMEFEYLDQNYMRVYSVRDKTKDMPIYRHQPAEFIDEIKLNFDWLKYFSDIFVHLINDGNYPDLNRNATATYALLGALISNEMKISLTLPIEKDNTFYGKKYPIT